MTRLPNGGIIARMRGTPSPVVFTADGRFDRVLMRAGNGPREIGSAGFDFLNAGADGTVRVVDNAKGGSHVFTTDLRYLRFDRGVKYGVPSAFITRSGTVVFAGTFETRELAGLPLHIANDTGAITRSFGGDSPIDPRLSPAAIASAMLRRVTPSDDTTFWSSNPSAFWVQKWATSGRPLFRIVHAMEGWYAEESRGRTPPRSREKNLTEIKHSSSPDLVWFLYTISTRPAASQARDPREPPMHAGVDLIVEAVDTKTWTVLATRRFQDLVTRHISSAPDRVAAVVPMGGDFTTFRIFRLTLLR
jgi:hypothetical protein